MLAAVIAVTGLAVPVFAANKADTEERYDVRMAQLTRLLEQDGDTAKAADKNAVFLSVSNGKSRAATFYAKAGSLSDSLNSVLSKAKASGVYPKWLKLDVVTSVEEISYEELTEKYLKGKRRGSLRKGIAFNSYFGRALLDSQLNSFGLLSYETGKLDLKKINGYFKETGKKKLDKIPDTLYLFETRGYFTDGHAVRLLNKTANTKGRRDYTTDRDGLAELAEMSSGYLSKLTGRDGKMVYGYYPINDEEMDDYNIIRHSGTVWNMVLQYDITRDKELLKSIDRAIGYLLNSLQWKDEKTAFLVDQKELNIGGNGIALLALTSYAEIMGTDRYNKEIEALANGVLFMQKKDGSFTHTLRKDYTVSRDYVIVFYDGEAMYGMLKAYGILGDSKYLNGAKKAANYFIDNNYEEQHSHWIAYGFNELTKYVPQKKYFAFGLRNVDNDYLMQLKNTRSGSPTRGEVVGATFELYDRLIKSGIKCEELKTYDEQLLIEAFESRIDYGLNYFQFPEYAMYFKNPSAVLNSFAIREDLFRIRIDDIQHFMGGYYLYWKNYDRVQELKNQ